MPASFMIGLQWVRRCDSGRRWVHLSVNRWWWIAPQQFSHDPLSPILILLEARIRDDFHGRKADLFARCVLLFGSAPETKEFR
jgi:hypothetical protein